MKRIVVFGFLLAFMISASFISVDKSEAGKIGKSYQTILTHDMSTGPLDSIYIPTNAYRGEMFTAVYFRIYTVGVSGGGTSIGWYPAFSDTQYADSLPLGWARPGDAAFTFSEIVLNQASDSMSVLIGGYTTLLGTQEIGYPPYILLDITETESAGYLKIDMYAIKDQ